MIDTVDRQRAVAAGPGLGWELVKGDSLARTLGNGRVPEARRFIGSQLFFSKIIALNSRVRCSSSAGQNR